MLTEPDQCLSILSRKLKTQPQCMARLTRASPLFVIYEFPNKQMSQ